MTTFIKEIIFEGFKSFGNQTVKIDLSQGYTCVVGPNGSGKSNIIDGLCFALGRLSKKTMRAKDLTDLIFVGTKTKPPAQKAKVSVIFDNSENTFQGHIGEDFEISREVNQKGKGVYRINGARATREAILMNLSLAGIDPDGFNFILQGKIVELTHMSTEDRRIFIEDLVGLQKFDEERDAALRELEKADQDLLKFEAIFQEVAKQLKHVKKEKDDATRWLELDNKIKELNARLIALNIKKLRDEEEQLLVFIDEAKETIEEITEEIKRCKDDMDRESNEMDSLTKEIENLEENRTDLEARVSNLRSDLSSKKTELKILNENLDKLDERKKSLEKRQEKLDEGTTYEDLLSTVKEEMEALALKISKTKTDIQDRENQQKKLESDIEIFNKELKAFNKKLNKSSSQKSSLETELKMTEERLVKLETKKESLEKELSKLLKDRDDNIEEAMVAAEADAKTIQDKIDKIKLELKKETQKQKTIELQVNQLRGDVSKVDSQIAEMKSKISVANSEKEMYDKEIFKINREKKTADLNKVQYNEEINKFSKLFQKVEEQLQVKQKLLDDMKEERDIITKNLESSQKEYEGVEEEIFGIMNTLEMLTGGISDNISEIKSEVQADGLDAIDSSMRQFKDYVADLLELIQTLKAVQKGEEEGSVEQALSMFDILLENSQESFNSIETEIEAIITKLTMNSTQEFTNFIQDLLDIMSQTQISLRKLSMTRNTEQINALHELDKKKSEVSDEFNELTVNKTKLEGTIKQAELDLQNAETNLKHYEEQGTDLKEKIGQRDTIIAENEEKIKGLDKDKSGILEKIEEKNKEKEEFWELSNKLNLEIEEENKILQEALEKIRGLKTVQKLINEIEEHETEIKESNQKIKTNTEKIGGLEEEIKNIEDSRTDKETQIQELQKQKAEVSQEEKDFRTQLDQENLEEQEKIKRENQLNGMIAREKEINALSVEIDDTNKSLEEGTELLDELDNSIKEVETNKNEVITQISDLNTRKQEVWEKQKLLQDELTKLNTNLSNNTNKLSNFENRKEEVGIKIEDLYERSKEFGALPEVLEGWTETGIKSEISKCGEEKLILEPVNLKSIEQYEIVKNRFDDIDLRRQSLQRERKAILENIEKIELEKTRQFMRAFNEINLHFSELFSKLSPGGIAKMLLENPAKPFEGGIAIEARPRGKKIKTIESLSGGEKTLVA
ncbi:MAG: AAA family ATPase, partial [Candidatus Hodarchaeota archaeon]